jgi:hypothetical protein
VSRDESGRVVFAAGWAAFGLYWLVAAFSMKHVRAVMADEYEALGVALAIRAVIMNRRR